MNKSSAIVLGWQFPALHFGIPETARKMKAASLPILVPFILTAQS
jgi:hypothetical protein